MSTGRAQVLGQVRAALAGAPAPPERGADPPAGPAPGRAELVELFTERAGDYRAVVGRIDRAAIGNAVDGVCDRHQVGRVVVPPGLPGGWGLSGSRYEVDGGLTARELDGRDAVVTACRVGIAETGTIVMDHGPDQGRRVISLIPDLHICLIEEAQIVWSVPDAFTHLGTDQPLTFVSGPSATSDIEFQRVEGVHGPRRLEILIVRNEL